MCKGCRGGSSHGLGRAQAPPGFLGSKKKLGIYVGFYFFGTTDCRTPALFLHFFSSSQSPSSGLQFFRFSAARGLALDQCSKLLGYSLQLLHRKRFEEGAEQFRIDVAHNPNDTEESNWCFLCEAQLYGIKEARERFLEISY
ncbi:uncharacterized protein LOC133720157 isoform X1 [Rosa rugosa]|uniref:uncharacterized protein LOC133720157 isoform X1 n=1 Tax=Rosa rugosa TaxID=74645 RepID=UPI002B411012|nr:uncharacterized protein LOC133720157 isoform X1 [Rosa rugosa]